MLTHETIIVVLLNVDNKLLIILSQQFSQSSKFFDLYDSSEFLPLEVVYVKICDDQTSVLLDSVLVPFLNFTREHYHTLFRLYIQNKIYKHYLMLVDVLKIIPAWTDDHSGHSMD